MTESAYSLKDEVCGQIIWTFWERLGMGDYDRRNQFLFYKIVPYFIGGVGNEDNS